MLYPCHDSPLHSIRLDLIFFGTVMAWIKRSVIHWVRYWLGIHAFAYYMRSIGSSITTIPLLFFMSDQLLPNLVQPIVLSTFHGECKNTVSQLTDQIGHCVTSLIDLLHNRSLALLESAQFDKASSDADAIQKLDPTCALGYLLKGHIYACQGRQRRAIHEVEQGLKMDSQDHQLLQAKANAVTSNNKRVDFISQLPLDIISTSLIPLVLQHEEWHVNNPYPYWQVSKSWRERFSRGGLHYYVYGEEDHEEVGPMVCIAESITALHIEDYVPDSALVIMLCQGRFPALKSMHTTGRPCCIPM